MMTARHRIGDQNVLVIGAWNFEIVWDLSIVIWAFSIIALKANSSNQNHFYLTIAMLWA
jgi:hypothetical protein